MLSWEIYLHSLGDSKTTIKNPKQQQQINQSSEQSSKIFRIGKGVFMRSISSIFINQKTQRLTNLQGLC
ncbi:hypothetical protein PVK06_033458 [Gossypium arboreum]|uniref:Uncharacterized protein n=1 Tax=Gossypium arboreum TaxID=29729 RepID=A0ABR0NC08_GOSAR|nr:hypothetical protein PVK06_033458 [Gossypium arboreum]